MVDVSGKGKKKSNKLRKLEPPQLAESLNQIHKGTAVCCFILLSFPLSMNFQLLYRCIITVPVCGA
jgi:hypothetical protein